MLKSAALVEKHMTGKTLYDKLWDQHRVRESDDGTALIYIDLQLLHEVTSAQAFGGPVSYTHLTLPTILLV